MFSLRCSTDDFGSEADMQVVALGTIFSLIDPSEIHVKVYIYNYIFIVLRNV